MTHLTSARGGEAEWPWLLRELLIAEFVRQRSLGYCYTGDVVLPRFGLDPNRATKPEPRAVMDLLARCRSTHNGAYLIGDEAYWLLGYEWPNEGSQRRKCADLVGLNRQGGLVVFECKLVNPYGPFAAVLEGLDYLSCLTTGPNFAKIEAGFAEWFSALEVIPEGFENVRPIADSRHEVIVLGSAEYYAQYRRSDRGVGWDLFAALPLSPSPTLSIRFAESDFTSPQGRWVIG